jgi:hypothetical protein
MVLAILEVDAVDLAVRLLERCLEDYLKVVRGHEHREVRQEGGRFANQQHVVAWAFLFRFAMVRVHLLSPARSEPDSLYVAFRRFTSPFLTSVSGVQSNGR